MNSFYNVLSQEKNTEPIIFWVLSYREVLGQNGPQIWTRGKGLIKGRYLDLGATLG